MKKSFIKIVSLGLANAPIQDAIAQVYKCQNMSGQTVYADTPCSTELPVSEQELKTTENIIDRSGARSLHQSNQRESRPSTPQQLINSQDATEETQLARQRQLGQKWIEEAREVSSRTGRQRDLWDRATQNKYAKQLQNSAAILLSSNQNSSRAVELLKESNALAKKAMRERDLWSRASLFGQSEHLQQSARTLFGSQSATDDSTPSRTPTNVPKPVSPSVITNCDAGGCSDNLGNRYNRAGGSTYVPATGGAACQEVGGMMHCP
jgi:hypothetical protein